MTLAPKGYHDFGGKLVGPMTAHPKIDAANGEMVFFGYAAKGRFTPDLSLHVVDRDGALLRSQWFQAPYPSMVHDFVVTRDWIILPIFPLTGSMDRAMKGLPPYRLGARQGHARRAGAAPRLGRPGALVQRRPVLRVPPDERLRHARRQGGVRHDEVPGGAAVPRARRPARQRRAAGGDAGALDLRPARAIATASANRPLDDHPGEFPRLDERYTALPYRHGWFQAGLVTDAKRGREARDGLAHIDHASGKVSPWMPAPGDHCGEPVFVPRRADAAEGDGFVLSVIFRAETQCSDLAVFDAQNLADGPLALAHLSHRVPAGFHGNWRDA